MQKGGILLPAGDRTLHVLLVPSPEIEQATMTKYQ